MSDELETILRLVADGTLTPQQAGPIIEALTRADAPLHDDPDERRDGRAERAVRRAQRRDDRAWSGDEPRPAAGSRQLRIRVTEHGRQVVNLRIPIGLVDAALGFVPGIGGEQSQRIREAVNAGTLGPIIDVEDPDGDGVLITIE